MIQNGKTQQECADLFGVTRPAISNRLKMLKIATTKDIALRSAQAVVESNLDAMAQLRKINDLINGELDHIGAEMIGKIGPERATLQDQRLKHVAEIRKQLSLALEIAQVLYNADEVKAFQQEVVAIIGEVAPETRNAIIQRLRERRAIRSSLEFSS